MEEIYETKLAAAYVRGIALKQGNMLSEKLINTPLDMLTTDEINEIILAGKQQELKMYYFKKKDLLPRVKAVLGFLRGIMPESLLDTGSGRGVFLFPFLTEFIYSQVTSVDILPHRVEMLQALSRGGIHNLNAVQMNICDMCDCENRFDVVTMLEVLEHIPDVQTAVNNAVRLSKKYVVVTVPSKPDNNPEHIHLLTKDKLTRLFENAGCLNLKFDGVQGHLLMIAKK